MVYDPRVCARHTRRRGSTAQRLTCGNALPLLPGGQVVATSIPFSPPGKVVFDLLFSVAETTIKVQLLFVWDHVFGCEAFFGRTCPMVK